MGKPAAGHVHLVGSIGLDTVETVFRTAGELLGPALRRLPDGEVGGRRLWVSWQYPLLRSSPYLQPDPNGRIRKTSGIPLLALADESAAEEIEFGELGYAREARASYMDFVAARERGEIGADLRFQVCLPTPMGVIYAFCVAPDVVAVERAYEQAMIREVEAICRAIPHHDLCLQWDICHEVLILDGQPQDQFPVIAASFDEIIARVVRISESVPADVELGYHLCYGDFGAKHILEPRDSATLVAIANGIVAAVRHPIAYFHVPVPISRDDDAYFKPLGELKLAPDTEMYLGLIHLADGVEGVQRRSAVARRYVPDFGVATECGMARARKRDLVLDILALHRDAVALPSQT